MNKNSQTKKRSCYERLKNEKFTASHFFSSNQFTAKFFSKTLISRKVCEKRVTVKFSQLRGKTRKSLSPKKIFRQINFLVTYLVKPLLSRNFSQKSVRENFRNFHTVAVLPKSKCVFSNCYKYQICVKSSLSSFTKIFLMYFSVISNWNKHLKNNIDP